tara:strand:- start:12588 stop:12884 length:297 start_codon:yes stop_codon:yes gene_type:complete
MNYITPIKTALDDAMHLHCNGFMLLGSPSETPRYYNVKGYDYESKHLTIFSTQKSGLFFTIDASILEIGYFDVSEFWTQFKEYRTAFLLENYPTISIY